MQEDQTTNTDEVVNEEVILADAPQPEVLDDANVIEKTETTEEESVVNNTEEAPAEASTQEEGEEQAPVAEKQPSRRENLRVQHLLAKYGYPTERQTTAPSQVKPTNALDYATALDADPEVIKQLEADRQAYSDQAYQQGIQQSITRDWKRDLKYEAPLVEKEYPFLNPKDETNFNPAAADAMSRKYLRFVGYNPGDAQKGVPESVSLPDLSYREFVESEMEFADEIASQKVAQTVKNVTKQVAMTGLRPDGSSVKKLDLTKAPENMSIEELYASIGQKPPQKQTKQ